MPLQPSRRDSAGPVPIIRHHQSSLRSRDPGYLDGRWSTPQPVSAGASDLGGDAGDDAGAGDETLYFIDTDQFVIDGPGDKVFVLSHIPIDQSTHVRWVPLYVPSSNWTLSEDVLRVTDPGWRDGDMVEVAYAYEYDGEPEPSDVVIPFDETGVGTLWKWIQVPFHDPTDYSSPTYDDTAWLDGVGPWGAYTPEQDGTSPFAPLGWPNPVTHWDQSSQMWARRTVAVEPGIPVVLSTRLNRTAILWWNGSYRGKTTAAEHTWDIPADLVLASNVVVFKVSDDSWAGPGTGCYFDVEIAQTVEEAPL